MWVITPVERAADALTLPVNVEGCVMTGLNATMSWVSSAGVMSTAPVVMVGKNVVMS